MTLIQRPTVALFCVLLSSAACDEPSTVQTLDLVEPTTRSDSIPTQHEDGPSASADSGMWLAQDSMPGEPSPDVDSMEVDPESSDSPDGGTVSPMEPDTRPRPASTGFAEHHIRWPVPESGSEDGFFSPWWNMDTRWFTTMDLTGDGRPDLVQTGDHTRQNGFVWRDEFGPYWKVWPGEGVGFAPDFIRWSVPESGQSDGFFAPTWSHGTRWFTTRDLDGDGRMDLIQSGDSSREGGFVWRDAQGPFWKVWRGGMQGFESQHTRWAVPESGHNDGFFALYWAHGDRWFSTMDLNGDGRLDLLQTGDPSRQGGHVFQDETGAYWRVWLGQRNGFVSESIRWSVPESGLGDGFFYPSWTQGERCFATMDLTGDGLPDLIQRADSERSGGYVWSDHSGAYWKVWPGRARGFSPQWTRWSVPDSGLGDGFFAPWWMQGERSFSTMDLTGDGIPDLVQSADPQRRGGYAWSDTDGAYWKVWPATHQGFAFNAMRWPVPSSGLDDGFFATNQNMDSRWFSTMDLNGDRRPDLIQSGDSSRNGGFVWRDATGPHWRVWLNR